MIKPVRNLARPQGPAAAPRLMDIQDTERKGDAGAPEASVLMGVKVPVSLKAELKVAAVRSGRTMASIVVDAIRRELASMGE
ncbi:MAG: hypothetical protein U0N15_11210 [Bifidobacterium choerinum]